jgi:hypothetical protein
VIGRAEDVWDGVCNSLAATVELDELMSGDFAGLIICALTATDAVPNVQIEIRNEIGRLLL